MDTSQNAESILSGLKNEKNHSSCSFDIFFPCAKDKQQFRKTV